MNALKFVLAAICLSILVPGTRADKLQTGSMTLLPGYRIEMASHATDSFGGKISKEGGFTIYYDNLVNAGTHTEDPSLVKKTRWRKEQTVDGHKMVVLLTRDNELVVSFPDWQANFFANVHSEQELADVLLMVVTYRPDDQTAAKSKN